MKNLLLTLSLSLAALPAYAAGQSSLTIHSSGTIIVPIIVRLTQALGLTRKYRGN